MPNLFDRLFPGSGQDNIPVHLFRAVMGDYAIGHMSRAEIVGYFALDTEAQDDLGVLLARLDALDNLGKAKFLLELHDVLMIAESGAKYATRAAFATRMGL